MTLFTKTAGLIAALIVFCTSADAQHTPRHLFQNALKAVAPESVATQAWCPYPDYYDRAAWDAYTADRKAELISNGEKFLHFEWRIVKATDYLAFERTGDRAAMQTPHHQNVQALSALTLAELAEGKGRFMDDIINGVWFQTERTSWVYSAHEYRQASGRALPDSRDIFIDLASQMLGLVMAFDLHFFGHEFDKVDPSISNAVRTVLKKMIFDPYMDPAKRKSQSWLGFNAEGEDKPHFWENWDPRNNWNVWCNVNVARTFLLAPPSREELLSALKQVAVSVDNYMDFVDMDGACDEGPGYWGHASGCLYEFVRLMNDATAGKFGCWDDPQFLARLRYISRVNLGDGWSVNFGDGNARSVGNAALAFRMGADCADKEMTDYATYLATFSPNMTKMKLSSSLHDALEQLRYLKTYESHMQEVLDAAQGNREAIRKDCRKDIPALTWYPGTQHFICKDASGLSFAVKGGHNEESHNHNDVGTIILFSDSLPVLVDIGPTTYMRQTFNMKERYAIWIMRSEWHNLPIMNGKPQHNGREYAAAWSKGDTEKSSFSAELSPAYVNEAGINSLVRSCRMEKGAFILTDKFNLKSRTAPDEEHFIVHGEVSDEGAGKLLISVSSFDGKRRGKVRMSYSPNLSASVEDVTLTDPRHIAVWGTELKRIVLKSKADAPAKGTYSIKVWKSE